jgi:hypothetical protein
MTKVRVCENVLVARTLLTLVEDLLVDHVVADRLAVEHAENVLDGGDAHAVHRLTRQAGHVRAAIRLFSAEFGTQRFSGVVEKQADLGREVPAFRMHDVNGCGRRLVFDENGLQ